MTSDSTATVPGTDSGRVTGTLLSAEFSLVDGGA